MEAAMRDTVKLFILGLVTTMIVSGCVFRARPLVEVETGPLVVIDPPPPRVEVIGVAPYPGYIWIGGYWVWEGGAYQWAPGRWEQPRPGYQWEPRSWYKHKGGWKAKGGSWKRK